MVRKSGNLIGCLMIFLGVDVLILLLPMQAIGQAIDHPSGLVAECARAPKHISRLGLLSFRHWDSLTSVVFSADGKLLLTSSNDHTVRLWAASTGKEIGRWTFPESVQSISMSPDNATIGASTSTGVWLWNRRRDQQPRLFAPAETVPVGQKGRLRNPMDRVLFSPDGKRFAWSSLQGAVWVASIQSGKLIFHRSPSGDLLLQTPVTLTFSPDGTKLALSTVDFRVRVWDLMQGKETLQLRGHERMVNSIAFSPGGETLVTSSEDRTLRFWDTATAKEVGRLSSSESVACTLFTPDGKRFVAADDSGLIRVYRFPSRQLEYQVQGPPTGIVSIACSPDGKRFAAVGEEEAIRIWNADTREELFSPPVHRARIWSLSFSPDGRTLATASGDGTVRVWDSALRTALTCTPEHRFPVRAVAYAPDGKQIASAGDDGMVRITDSQSGKQIRSWKAGSVRVYHLAYCQSGRFLITHADDDDRVLLWDATSGRYIDHLECGRNVCGFAVSPRGTELAIAQRIRPASGSIAVGVWNLALRVKVQTFSIRRNCSFLSLTFSPDSRLIAVAPREKTTTPLMVYEVASGMPLTELKLPREHPELTPESIAFTIRGEKLFAGTAEGFVLSWDFFWTQTITLSQASGGGILCLACSPDGRRLASGSTNSTVLLWKISRPTPHFPGEHARLSPKQCDTLWEELRTGDASKAYKAVRLLAASPEAAVKMLQARLAPAAVPDRVAISRYIAGLSSENTQVRQRAMCDLRSIGASAIPALQERLEAKPPLEESRRIRQLLPTLTRWQSAELRVLRAIQVLEAIGTPEAHLILERLAKGARESRLTKEAQDSLQRLRSR
jgi:WD40 repeat protein